MWIPESEGGGLGRRPRDLNEAEIWTPGSEEGGGAGLGGGGTDDTWTLGRRVSVLNYCLGWSVSITK